MTSCSPTNLTAIVIRSETPVRRAEHRRSMLPVAVLPLGREVLGAVRKSCERRKVRPFR